MANYSLTPDIHFYLTDWEANASEQEYTAWTRARNYIPVTTVCLYLMLVPMLQSFMKNRKPFQLKRELIVWNAGLAVFSIMCFLRGFPLIRYQLQHMTFEEKACSGTSDGPSIVWGFLFSISKFFELVDTLFLILRKREVPFLHWYHHSTVLMFTWFSFSASSSMAPIFGTVNAFIHSLMYSYYALRAMGVSFPKPLSMSLTSMQIIQMGIGMYSLFLHWNAEQKGAKCSTPPVVWLAGVLMYASYFALFVQFFINAYMTKRKPRKVDENNNHIKAH